MKTTIFLLGIIFILSTISVQASIESKISAAHQEYKKRHLGYKSSHLPRPGRTRGDDYRNCVDQRYYRNADSHDFCAWHAGIGKYQ